MSCGKTTQQRFKKQLLCQKLCSVKCQLPPKYNPQQRTRIPLDYGRTLLPERSAARVEMMFAVAHWIMGGTAKRQKKRPGLHGSVVPLRWN